MRVFLLLIAFFTFAGSSDAQMPGWNWSAVNCSYENKDDSTFLVNSTRKFWSQPSRANDSVLYQGDHVRYSFQNYQLLDRDERKIFLAATEIKKIKFINQAELLTLWNSWLDTCVLVSYEPLILRTRKHDNQIDTTCWLHCSLLDYKKHSPSVEFQRRQKLAIDALATAMHGWVLGDTIHRIVRFTNDSNEYLPQADYQLLGLSISWLGFADSIKPFGDKELRMIMSEDRWDKTSSVWDSTNRIEYPEGVFISAPIKSFRPVKTVVLYEKWIPDYSTNSPIHVGSRVETSTRFSRRVVSYGLLYEGTGLVWFNAEQVHRKLILPRFNLEPYHECFRAERFERMHNTLDPW